MLVAPIYFCLTERHSPRLVALAVLVCVLASFTALKLAQRAIRQRQGHAELWLAAAGLVAGAGTWATHFIAILAFDPGAPVQFDALLTSVSIAIAAAGGILAFAIGLGTSRPRLVLGGVCLGIDISAMHYTGMAAIHVVTFRAWDLALVALSVLLSLAFATPALKVGLTEPLARRRTLAATILLVLAVCSLHFTGMGAIKLASNTAAGTHISSPTGWLAAMIGVVAALVLIAALAGIGMDRYLALRIIHERRRLRALSDATFEGIIIIKGGTIIDVNRSLLILAARKRADLVGRPITSLIVPSSPTARDTMASLDGHTGECCLSLPEGTAVPIEVFARAFDDYAKGSRVLAVRDLTERVASRNYINKLSFQDPVTELPNRAFFLDRLRTEAALANEDRPVAVLRLSIDRFEAVNHAFGLTTADNLLRAIARRIVAVIPTSSTIARVQDDEFGIILPNSAPRVALAALCRRLVDVLGQPFDVDGQVVVTGAHIGIKIIQPGSGDAEGILQRSGLALNEAKADPTSRWSFYAIDMDEQMLARHRLEIDLRKAVATGAFELHYQPLVAIVSGKIVGCEALLRWRHETRGYIPPTEFIPIAEEIGIIGLIGRWVIATACASAASWPVPIRVAVNLSPAQFQEPDLVTLVERTLAATGLHPKRLELEITESVLLDGEHGVLERLEELRGHGVRIAMDDFGTGFSSLSYLRRFPFDKLKLDQSLVRGVGADADSSAIVRAMVGLGHSLGMTVTAEGVETEAEWNALRNEHCDEGQGYLFSRPLPVQDFVAHLTAATEQVL